MEKPTKKDSRILILAASLVIFAWLCRLLGIPFKGGSNPIRTVLYPALFILWGFTLHHRLIHPEVRRLAVGIAFLMVFWFTLRTIKYSLPDRLVDPERYLWYLYYLPMIFIPTLAVLMAGTIGLSETQRLPRKYRFLLFIAAALFLMVITNDLHQLVFAFPDNGTPWTDDDYSYRAGYYAYAVYVVACNLATLMILFLKNRNPGNRRRRFLPCIPIFLLMVYWLFYILHAGWLKLLFGDLTAFSCVMYAAAFELCIRCGLILSNSGYQELFRSGSLGAEILDQNLTVCLAGANTGQLTEEQIIRAASHPLLIDKTTLLKSRPIRFGSVLWREDVSVLTETIEQFEENCRDLEEKSRIDRENLKAEKTLLSLQEKNRAVDLLQRETASQIGLIEDLLTKYDAEKDETLRQRFLAGAAVVGAYIKRYGNLLLVSERSEEADIADLVRCFEESFMNLALLDVECLCTLPQDTVLKTGDMLRIYRTFEAILEDSLFELHHVWINGREQDGCIILNMEFVSETDLSQHAGKTDAFSYDSGTSRFNFRIQKGGAGE